MLPEPVEELVAAMTTEEKRSLAQTLTRMVAAALEGRVAPSTPVATDDLRAYDSVCERLGCPHEVRPAKPKAGERALGMVDALRKGLADFLRPFNAASMTSKERLRIRSRTLSPDL